MAFLKRGNASIYYEEQGQGDPLIAVHGLILNTKYWSLTGIADTLAKSYRVISMEMRGHGRTVVDGEPYGFDVDTMGDDIIALADHLKLGRFHLLTHSTGGMASVRHAMKDSSRFATLILTDTSSFTSVVPGPPENIKKFHDDFAKNFEKFTWDQIIGSVKIIPNPFFRGIAESEQRDELLSLTREIVELNDRDVVAAFVRSFYTDPDMRIEELRKISCPVLVIYGDKDDLFMESCKTMAREIPGAEVIEYPGIGHMTAIEAPRRLASDVIDFLSRHPMSVERVGAPGKRGS
ncbi:MAG: hypothetical protein A2176_06900 [Spirochaetes bacterium RBG_13_51_14]|nr:MAG: hypothetical protein A2176_06900 [Spirochaetes bacterium RBG_13_51_14]